MRYNAVLPYVDETSPSFPSFRFPAHLLSNHENKSVTTAENCKKKYIHMYRKSWIVLKDSEAGRTIELIPYTG